MVVAYRNDEFTYLKDKYKEVKLIEIKDYETINTATVRYKSNKLY